MLNQLDFWPAMCSHQVIAQPPKRVNVINRELNGTSSKRYLPVIKKGIYQSSKRYLPVIKEVFTSHLYFVQAKLEIHYLRILTDFADLNGRK